MATTGGGGSSRSKDKEKDKDKHEKTELHYSMFKCFNRKFKINEVEPPFDVKECFSRYSDRGTHLSVNDFQRFLVDFQGESDVSLSAAENIIQQVLQRRHQVSQFSRHSLSIDDFFHFLLFDDLNGPIKSRVHHDMTAPLSHYFIYTGHNSYLTGNQLSSDCSDIPIIKALQRGVRVIELDLWPNASKDDIQVLHGRTLTTPVSLSKCLRSIKEYAFVRSPYPVIITFEDHLTPDLQAKVAEMTTQILGKMLHYPQAGCLAEFPSPESLMNRIIISTKPPKEYLESKSRKEREETQCNGKNSSDEDTPGREVFDFLAALEADERGTEVDQDDEDFNVSDCKSPQRGAPEYKRLITIHAGKPKGHLKDELKIMNEQVRRLSLSEQGLEKAVTSYGKDTVRFTQKNILRIYPKGTRVTSSNFKPHIGWIHGAQMVAFNMQGYGKSLWLMHGMFKANGTCGYVKKPDFLMRTGPNKEVFDPKRTLLVKKRLRVRVYMGNGWRSDFSQTHFDTFSPPDFYTKLRIVGVPADAAKRKTKIIEDNWVPVWDEEFEFALAVPELALLLIEVREYDMSEKDDFGGQTCLPVSELRAGIRAVPLHDKKGDKLKSVKLLMRFQFVDEG